MALLRKCETGKKKDDWVPCPIHPVAPQDEAGLTTTFQTWPRGCFHVAKHPDFPVPS